MRMSKYQKKISFPERREYHGHEKLVEFSEAKSKRIFEIEYIDYFETS